MQYNCYETNSLENFVSLNPDAPQPLPGTFFPNLDGSCALGYSWNDQVRICERSSSIQSEPTTTPRKIATLPRQTTTPPRRIIALPRLTTAPPRLTTAPPRQTTTLPRQTTTQPRLTTAPPRQTTTQPRQTTTLPRQTTAPPRQTTTLPRQTTTPPRQTTTQPMLQDAHGSYILGKNNSRIYRTGNSSITDVYYPQKDIGIIKNLDTYVTLGLYKFNPTYTKLPLPKPGDPNTEFIDVNGNTLFTNAYSKEECSDKCFDELNCVKYSYSNVHTTCNLHGSNAIISISGDPAARWTTGLKTKKRILPPTPPEQPEPTEQPTLEQQFEMIHRSLDLNKTQMSVIIQVANRIPELYGQDGRLNPYLMTDLKLFIRKNPNFTVDQMETFIKNWIKSRQFTREPPTTAPSTTPPATTPPPVLGDPNTELISNDKIRMPISISRAVDCADQCFIDGYTKYAFRGQSGTCDCAGPDAIVVNSEDPTAQWITGEAKHRQILTLRPESPPISESTDRQYEEERIDFTETQRIVLRQVADRIPELLGPPPFDISLLPQWQRDLKLFIQQVPNFTVDQMENFVRNWIITHGGTLAPLRTTGPPTTLPPTTLPPTTRPPTTEPPQPPTPNVTIREGENFLVLYLPVNNIFGYKIESDSLKMAGVNFPGMILINELNNEQKQINTYTTTGVEKLYVLNIPNVPNGNYIINIRTMDKSQTFSEFQQLSVTIGPLIINKLDNFQNVENTDTCYSNYQMFLLLAIILLLFGAIYYANKK